MGGSAGVCTRVSGGVPQGGCPAGDDASFGNRRSASEKSGSGGGMPGGIWRDLFVQRRCGGSAPGSGFGAGVCAGRVRWPALGSTKEQLRRNAGDTIVV